MSPSFALKSLSVIPSPTPIDILTSPLAPSKISTRTDPEKPLEVPPELYELPFSPPVPQQPHVSSHAKSMVKTTKNGVRGGIIIDSDDDLGEEPLTKPMAKPGSKRKASELSDIGEDARFPEPARKKLHLERLDAGTKTSSAKKGLLKRSMIQSNRQPSALDDSVKTNKPLQVPVAAASSKSLKPTAPQIHSRINGMRAKDGTRPTAASTPPPRHSQPNKTDVPRSVQELSQRLVKETLEAKVSL
jgi:hypothetical protein